MNEDFRKLTTYVGERQRSGHRLLTDALLDLYARELVATSIVLRGMEGFGPKHHLRTDTSLTLSEDLPAVTVAVDRRERIEALADQVAMLVASGLVTVERARVHHGLLSLEGLPQSLHAATKLTVYVGRRDRVGRVPAYLAVCDLLHRHGIAGASVLLGVDGTVGGRRRRARFFGANADVPVMIVAVGPGDRVCGVTPELGRLLERPLLTLERVRICKRDGVLLDRPSPRLGDEASNGWQKLTVYASESQLVQGRPLHRVLTRRLRAAGAAGSTTVRGIWGFHGDHVPHGDRTLQRGRGVPAVTVVLDTAEGIERSFGIVDEVTAQHGLVTVEAVPRVWR